MWRWLSSLPLGMKLYFWFWTVLVPAGVALLLAGAVVPGLVLLVCFVFDQAVFTPLIVSSWPVSRKLLPASANPSMVLRGLGLRAMLLGSSIPPPTSSGCSTHSPLII